MKISLFSFNFLEYIVSVIFFCENELIENTRTNRRSIFFIKMGLGRDLALTNKMQDANLFIFI